MRIAVVGAGLMGCTLARLCAEQVHTVQVFERQPRIGGLCADGYDADGDFVQFHGAHIFHTHNPQVEALVRRFGEWRSTYRHRVVVRIGEQTVPVPINTTTLAALETDLSGAVNTLYEPYSRKQWGEHWETMRDAALARVGTRESTEDRYFPDDDFQGYPRRGFSALMAQMLRSARITVVLNRSPDLEDLSRSHDRVYWTGRIDEPFGYCEGVLPYRTMRFRFSRQFPVENFPSADVDQVKRTHFALLLTEGGPGKLVDEIPGECGRDDIPTHPVTSGEARRLWEKYRALLPPNVLPVGRIAEMQYLDMDQTIERAFEVIAQPSRSFA